MSNASGCLLVAGVVGVVAGVAGLCFVAVTGRPSPYAGPWMAVVYLAFGVGALLLRSSTVGREWLRSFPGTQPSRLAGLVLSMGLAASAAGIARLPDATAGPFALAIVTVAAVVLLYAGVASLPD